MVRDISCFLIAVFRPMYGCRCRQVLAGPLLAHYWFLQAGDVESGGGRRLNRHGPPAAAACSRIVAAVVPSAADRRCAGGAAAGSSRSTHCPTAYSARLPGARPTLLARLQPGGWVAREDSPCFSSFYDRCACFSSCNSVRRSRLHFVIAGSPSCRANLSSCLTALIACGSTLRHPR